MGVLPALLLVFLFQAQTGEQIRFDHGILQGLNVEVVEHSQFRTVIDFALPSLYREEKSIEGRRFDFIRIPHGYEFLGEAGKPELPIVTKWIVIPDDKDVELKILSHKCDTLEGYTPVPHQDRFRQKKFVIDSEFYSKNLTYPDELARISDPEIMRDYRFVVLTLQPVRCNPARNEIYVYHHMEIELRYSGQSQTNILKKIRPYTSHAFEPIYRHLFINYGFVTSDSVGRGTYLIITADVLQSAIQPLADWRNRIGMRTKLVRVSDICDPPSDSLIKEYLVDAYYNWEYPPEYLLIAGDVEDVPTYIFSDCAWESHYYGEIDGVGWNGREILVGRFSTSDESTLAQMVSRVVEYERDPDVVDPAWFRKGCTINGADWISPWSALFIRDELLDYGFTWVDTLFSRSGLATAPDITNAVNEGRLFTVYYGHGWPGGWWLTDWSNTFVNSDVYALSNGQRLPVVIAASCGTGMFQQGTCHGEAWSREKGLAYIGAGSTPASGLCYQIPNRFIGAYVDSIYKLGQCSAIGIGNFGFNLLGDPGCTIWGDMPESLTCTYDDTIPAGPGEFCVLVREGANPVEGATMCLMSTNDVYCVGSTGASGEVTLYPVPRSDDTVYVTVTSPFHVPHEGSVIVDHSAPFPGYLSHTIDDAAGGNGNGILNPGETVSIQVTLKNYGDATCNNANAILRTPDALVTVTDSSAMYGDLPPGAEGTQEFTFAVSDSYQYQGQRIWLIPFEMKVSDSISIWEFPVSKEELRAPDIVYVDHTVPGNPQPGDTASIAITLMNAGNDSASFAFARVTSRDPYVEILSDSSAFGPMGVGASADNASNPFRFATHSSTPRGHIAEFTIHAGSSDWIEWFGTRNETFEVKIGEMPPPVTVFFDDFESGLSHWEFNGGHWSDSTLTYYSPTHSLTLVPDTTANEQIAAMNFGVDVSQYRPPLDLSFYASWYFDPWGEYQSYIDMSTDGAASWQTVWFHFCAIPPDTSFRYLYYWTDSCGNGFTNVRFRLRLEELFQPPPDTACFFIDDFWLATPVDNTPPSFTNTTLWEDTIYQGPFSIASIITDDNYGLAQCSLYYEVNSGSWFASPLDTTGNPYEYVGEIPSQNPGDTVFYYLAALDSFPIPNRGTDPIAAPDERVYSFVIRPVTGIAERELPRVYRLHQNHPNPFSGITAIKYSLPRVCWVSLRIYDVSGRLVTTLVAGKQKPGFYRTEWDAMKMPSGVYFCKLDAGDFVRTKKLVLLRQRPGVKP